MELLLVLLMATVAGGVAILMIVQQIGLFIAALYYARYYYSQAEFTGKRRWPTVRAFWGWKIIKQLYNHRVIFDKSEVALDFQTHSTIFGCHRHGILALSAGLTFMLDVPGKVSPFGKVSLAVHSLHFMIPFWSDLMVWMGAIDVGKRGIIEAIKRGDNVALVPGGITEMGQPYDPTKSLPSGFIRIAFDNGCNIVPVYMHNEEKVCWSWQSEPRWINRFRYFNARLIRYPFPTFFLPHLLWKVPSLTTYVGKTIHHSKYAKNYLDFESAYRKELLELERTSNSAEH